MIYFIGYGYRKLMKIIGLNYYELMGKTEEYEQKNI